MEQLRKRAEWMNEPRREKAGSSRFKRSQDEGCTHATRVRSSFPESARAHTTPFIWCVSLGELTAIKDTRFRAGRDRIPFREEEAGMAERWGGCLGRHASEGRSMQWVTSPKIG